MENLVAGQPEGVKSHYYDILLYTDKFWRKSILMKIYLTWEKIFDSKYPFFSYEKNVSIFNDNENRVKINEIYKGPTNEHIFHESKRFIYIHTYIYICMYVWLELK